MTTFLAEIDGGDPLVVELHQFDPRVPRCCEGAYIRLGAESLADLRALLEVAEATMVMGVAADEKVNLAKEPGARKVAMTAARSARKLSDDVRSIGERVIE